MPCEQAAPRVACAPKPAVPGPMPAPSYPPKLPAPVGKNQSREFLCDCSHISARSRNSRKGRDRISFLLSKYFDPISHIMHQSPQAEIKQVSAVSAPGLFLLFSMDF